MQYKEVMGGICAPKGFAAAGVHCGIRANHTEKYDLALIKADVRCAAAGVYTTNKVCGAPIKVDRAHLADGYAQAIVVNSGNANTCAANGVALAEECCELVGKALDIDAMDVLPASTGVIGQPMVIDPFARGIPAAAAKLAATEQGSTDAATAIMTTKPLEYHKDLTYPNIGPRDSYLLYHEELESLVKNFPTIKRARFWMTFGQEYLTHLRVIQNIGMARIDEIDYNGVKIVPLQFLKAVLPNPQDLGENYEGETSIGCRIRGVKDGKERTYYVYNNCSHQEAYKETGMQGVSYTTGVPAMIGAMMFLQGLWKRPGVWNVEEFDPDPFMEQLNKQGLPWHEVFDGDLEL